MIKGHEIDQKDLIESLRIHALIGLQPHMKKGSHLSPSKLWPLPWDEKPKPFTSTEDDFAKARKMLEIADKLKKEKNGYSQDRS